MFNLASMLKSTRDEAFKLLTEAESVILPQLKTKLAGGLKALGATDDQITAAETAVQGAATAVVAAPGADKRATAIDEFKKLFSEVEPFLVNLLIDSAFGYLRAAGKV